MPNRLTFDDESLFPIQAFFNTVGDDSFLRVVDSLTKGVGYSINDCDCSFPDDLEPDEQPFDGVRFSWFERSIVISTAQLGDYIRLLCKEFGEKSPTDHEQINDILARL